MSGRFVRASKYRHVFGQPAKRELSYDNLKISKNAWDSNLIKANSKFLSVNWDASGGGAFAVIPLNEVGKCPDVVPLFRGHTSTVLDTDFNPFNERMIASSSDDGKIGIWEIPEDYSFFNYTNSEGEAKDIKPLKKLSGHLRKVGHLKFHPLAENILVSSSNDYSVKVWNIQTGKPILTLQHKDLVTSFAFSYDGNKLATTSRDKKIRVWDLRTGEMLQEGAGHSGAKNARCVWLGTANRIATTGFSRLSDRQIGIWNSDDIGAGPINGFINIDSSAGILMPFFDDCTNMLYLAGKGDGNIRYYEFTPKDDELYDISEFQSVEPQRGFAIAPKRAVNVKENEILKAFKTVKDTTIEPISFIVPRRAEMFQFDLYPDAPAAQPALTTEEWVAGKKVSGPVVFNMESLYDEDVDAFYTKSDGKPTEVISSPEPKSPVFEEKPEPVKEEPKSPVNVAAAASPKLYQKPKSSIDALLEKNEVSDLLKKSEKLDNHNNVENPSDNEDDGEFASQYKADSKPAISSVPKPAPVSSIPKPAAPVEPKSVKKEEPKIEAAVIKEEPKAEPKVEKKTEKKTEEEAVKAGKPATSTPATKGGATLKATVEKLATLVDKLESHISDLQAANSAKDVKLEQLEEKINQLLKK
ncbi:Crn1 protein [Saccharomycopsis crataegensis]|uniref:Coronin n=1 Tax=Saccharomycopsis crataegensis TaxID=43959 RepID=A0AAV5QPL8_9ASCO|nr:Crn1 protein [Saccharomycopsis crataegensis]